MDHDNGRTLYLMVTRAPLTSRTATAAAAVRDRDWHPVVIATPGRLSWLPRNLLAALAVPVLTEQRHAEEAKRQPPAGAVLLAPPTFNTVNKLASGIADMRARVGGAIASGSCLGSRPRPAPTCPTWAPGPCPPVSRSSRSRRP